MQLQDRNIYRLGELRPGFHGIITGLSGTDAVVMRLLEMGFKEGRLLEVLHEAPVSRDPIAVRIRGVTVSIRRDDANFIWVQEN